MSGFRGLVEQLYIAHKEFKKAWKVYEPYCMSAREPQEVTIARDKFYEKLDAVFDKLNALVQPFGDGDSKAIDAVLEFVEVDIPAYRCGYAKQMLFRRFKSVPLNESQEQRLRQLAYKLCLSPNYGKEFVDVTRLMIKLADKSLIRELQKLLENSDELVRKKTQRMLSIVLHHRKDLRDNVELPATTRT